MKISNIAWIALLACQLSACEFSPETFVESGSDSQLVNLIGNTYQTKADMQLVGITLDPNYAKRVDYYAVVPMPGIGGPEVVEKHLVRMNSIMRIEGVQRCTNCLVHEERLKVQIEPAIGLRSGVDLYLLDRPPGSVIIQETAVLNPEAFKQLQESR